ncbi:HIRAN domain-containing protein [Candidatus Enterococcus huntleyi]|uniref:HIRAN domain-containing protein n=1 Tax=Candidatus Enterococcus huntleyi TaxID=1857217 RepID=UPI0013798157|nr:HIRAN domain-containing protein [Enterococcus sp. JM4C]
MQPFIERDLYITITGTHHYFGMKPFEIGNFLSLVKEPNNFFDEEAIAVMAPVIGKVGYVANSPHTLARGCMSAGRIYDLLPNECMVVPRFITQTKIIARVYPDKKLVTHTEITIADSEEFKEMTDFYRKLTEED